MADFLKDIGGYVVSNVPLLWGRVGGGDVSRASAHDDFVLQTSSNGISGNIEE